MKEPRRADGCRGSSEGMHRDGQDRRQTLPICKFGPYDFQNRDTKGGNRPTLTALVFAEHQENATPQINMAAPMPKPQPRQRILGGEPELQTTLSLRQLSSRDVTECFGHARLEGLCGRECGLLSERRQFLGLLG
jgi:hypothetical protein